MSRSNSNKKRRSEPGTSVLIVGEGSSEKAFIKHLKGLYCHNSGVGVRIRKGRGGNPKTIVITTKRMAGTYNRRIAVVDNDKGRQQMEDAERKAKDLCVEIVWHKPCLDAVLLEIRNSGVSYAEKDSRQCKKEFERKYISKKHRSDLHRYERVFPKELLDERRSEVAALDRLIRLLSDS